MPKKRERPAPLQAAWQSLARKEVGQSFSPGILPLPEVLFKHDHGFSSGIRQPKSQVQYM